MASDLTPYFGNIILRWLNGDAAMPSSPSGLFLGLFNGNPKTSGTEVGATINPSNKRKAITFTALASGATHLLTSSADVDWGLSSGAGQFSHFALFDDAAAGHMYASRPVNGGPFLFSAGSSVKFFAGAVTFNIGSDS